MHASQAGFDEPPPYELHSRGRFLSTTTAIACKTFISPAWRPEAIC